jgi:hypothetical protein
MQRMTKAQEKQATEELLEILANYPNGVPTSALIGTKKFHGQRTLSSRQIIRLLRASGLVNEALAVFGKYSRIWWTLKR